jgi:hypothetical protein
LNRPVFEGDEDYEAKCSVYTILKARTMKDTTDPKSSEPPTTIAHLSIPIFPFVLFIP